MLNGSKEPRAPWKQSGGLTREASHVAEAGILVGGWGLEQGDEGSPTGERTMMCTFLLRDRVASLGPCIMLWAAEVAHGSS